MSLLGGARVRGVVMWLHPSIRCCGNHCCSCSRSWSGQKKKSTCPIGAAPTSHSVSVLQNRNLGDTVFALGSPFCASRALVRRIEGQSPDMIFHWKRMVFIFIIAGLNVVSLHPAVARHSVGSRACWPCTVLKTPVNGMRLSPDWSTFLPENRQLEPKSGVPGLKVYSSWLDATRSGLLTQAEQLSSLGRQNSEMPSRITIKETIGSNSPDWQF